MRSYPEKKFEKDEEIEDISQNYLLIQIPIGDLVKKLTRKKCRGRDLNPRTPMRSDFESDAVGHLATPA